MPHRTFGRNRPSTTILLSELSAYTLGQLIARYEHQVFTQGWLGGINPFDQWGVELGKVSAMGIHADITRERPPGRHDSSTAMLIEHYRTSRKEIA